MNVTHTAVAIPAGALSDRIGKEKVLAMGYGVFLASALLIKLSPTGLPAAYLIAAVFGLYMGVVETVQRALIPGYAGPGLRGTAYGVYYLVVARPSSWLTRLWEPSGSSTARRWPPSTASPPVR
ncbi:MAG: MFS transporter [Candidatus Bathyarchaeota archaeon]|nr:MFS transporter [Candidatus Bathyarchaeota archaeon]MDH5791449.1 MFS transporter [Candidatus Bathyarchaeota archaeon]